MHLRLILQLLIALAIANTTPVLINRFLGRRWCYPIDGGVKFVDRQPLLGSSKTIRGIAISILLTAAGAALIGLGWKVGLTIGAAAMGGDLFSSFLKRRMNLEASSKATGLDQIPESLFPLLACRHTLSLTALDIVITVVVFFLGEVLLARLFYKLHLREHPY
jgi:CDP-2,3-bis-(O-geranylgeranyl)-sn-glycerol synthase